MSDVPIYVFEKVQALTPRMQEAWHLMATGHSAAEMAAKLSVAKCTAENYRNRVNRALGSFASWRFPDFRSENLGAIGGKANTA